MTRQQDRMGRPLVALLAAAVMLATSLTSTVPAAQASEIRVIVNNEIVTSYDIARRTAFLRLQRRSGNLQAAATDQLIDEALQRDATRRAGIIISDAMVDRAFANFARGNNMKSAQMAQILNEAGVTIDHFKDYIRTQMGWGQTVQVRQRAERNLITEQDMVAQMLERGGQKPSSTEYILQQVVFLVPEGNRGQIPARRREANRMRAQISSCDNTVNLAHNLRNVTIRDLGRILALQLPELWADEVQGLQAGQTTVVKDTDRGVEFIVVCRARQVSDDRVAQLQFSTEALEAEDGDGAAALMKQLRENARIQRR